MEQRIIDLVHQNQELRSLIRRFFIDGQGVSMDEVRRLLKRPVPEIATDARPFDDFARDWEDRAV